MTKAIARRCMACALYICHASLRTPDNGFMPGSYSENLPDGRSGRAHRNGAIALDEGADDYLNKPFDPYELLARLRAVLRRAARAQAIVRRADAAGRRPADGPDLPAALAAGYRAGAHAKAALLLDYLITHPDELLSRDRLLEVLWRFDFPVGTRAVDNRIAELRRALGDDPVRPPRL